MRVPGCDVITFQNFFVKGKSVFREHRPVGVLNEKMVGGDHTAAFNAGIPELGQLPLEIQET